MTMPADTPTWLRHALEDLTRAQTRSEDRFSAVETQLVGLAAAQSDLVQQVAGLASEQRQTAAQVSLLAAAQKQTTDRLGALTRWAWEANLRSHAASFLGQIARRVRVLLPPQLDNLLDSATQDGHLSEDEAEELRRADLVCLGRDPQSGKPVVIVVEVSARVATRDVDRALTRAQMAAKLGEQVIPVVAGERIDRDAQQRAEQAGVRQIIAA